MEDINIFSIDLARKYGVEQSVMINFLQKVMSGKNTFNRKIDNGKVWIYLPTTEIDFYLPFWNEPRINRLLTSLVYHQVICRKVIPELGKGFSYSFTK